MLASTILRVLALLCCIGIAYGADDYPSKTVRVIVGFAPGGGQDTLARIVARKLTEIYSQQFLVDNRPGAGGVIGANIVAKSPDGYILHSTVSALAANHTLYPNLPYDTLRDFVPIILVGSTPNVLAAHPSLPVKTVKEFIALAKARPNELSYASTGTGANAFLAAELFKLRTGLRMIHVPYKGAGPALVGLLSGETQVMIVALPATIPYIRSGRLRALGVTDVQRAPMAPEIPTLIETGIQGMEWRLWYGMHAPTIARDVVPRLNASINKILAMSDIKAQLASEGIQPIGGTPEAFGTYFKSEVDRLAELIRVSGAKVD